MSVIGLWISRARDWGQSVARNGTLAGVIALAAAGTVTPALAKVCAVKPTTQMQVNSQQSYLTIQLLLLHNHLSEVHNWWEQPSSGANAYAPTGALALGYAASALQDNAPQGAVDFSKVDASSTTFNRSVRGRDYNFWVNSVVQYGFDPTGSGTNAHYQTYTGAIGIDRLITPELALGLAFGFGGEHANDAASGARESSSNLSATIYASYRLAPLTYLDAIAGYSAGQMKSTRQATLTNDILTGTRDANEFYGSLAATRDLYLGRVKVSGFVRGDVYSVSLGAYSEQGGDTALAYSSASSTVVAGVVGLRTEFPIEFGTAPLRLQTSIDYHHAFTGSFDQTVSYVADPNLGTANYSVALQAPDQLNLGVGLKAALSPSIDCDIGYQVSATRNGYESSTVHAALNFAF